METGMELRLAILIDADNVPAFYIKGMLEEAARYGTPTIKRIYGDWTKPNLGSWKSVLLEHAITPVQQYSYTTGKNATDSAMIIDAMDILYMSHVDGFCIVSSDSDFTRLAVRLRESGKKVIGFGEKKTPNPFIVACDKFIYMEVLQQPLKTVRLMKPADRSKDRIPVREAGRAETPRLDAGRAESIRAEAAKPEAVRPETARTDAARPETAKPDATRQDARRDHVRAVASAKPVQEAKTAAEAKSATEIRAAEPKTDSAADAHEKSGRPVAQKARVVRHPLEDGSTPEERGRLVASADGSVPFRETAGNSTNPPPAGSFAALHAEAGARHASRESGRAAGLRREEAVADAPVDRIAAADRAATVEAAVAVPSSATAGIAAEAANGISGEPHDAAALRAPFDAREGGEPVPEPREAAAAHETVIHRTRPMKATEQEFLDIQQLIASTVENLADESGWAFLGDIGNLLIRKKPDFDPRLYGFSKLTPMIRSLDQFDVDVRDTNQPNVKHIYIRFRG